MKREMFARSQLVSIRQDPGGMSSLRSLFLRDGVGSGGSVTDDTVLNFIAIQLASGRLRLCQSGPSIIAAPSADPAATSGANAAAPVQNEKPFPLASRAQPKTPESTPPPDQSSFPSDVRLVSLAQVLKQASRSGAPFCEECLKAAQRA
jgi:hypothetical protein